MTIIYKTIKTPILFALIFTPSISYSDLTDYFYIESRITLDGKLLKPVFFNLFDGKSSTFPIDSKTSITYTANYLGDSYLDVEVEIKINSNKDEKQILKSSFIINTDGKINEMSLKGKRLDPFIEWKLSAERSYMVMLHELSEDKKECLSYQNLCFRPTPLLNPDHYLRSKVRDIKTPIIELTLKDKGEEIMSTFTRKNFGKPIGVSINGKLINILKIRSKIGKSIHILIPKKQIQKIKK